MVTCDIRQAGRCLGSPSPQGDLLSCEEPLVPHAQTLVLAPPGL